MSNLDRTPNDVRGAVLRYSLYSFLCLATMAVLQGVVAAISGSRALLADTVHTAGDLSDFLVLSGALLLAQWLGWSETAVNRWAGRIIAGVMVVGALLLLWDVLGPLIWLLRTCFEALATASEPIASLAEWVLQHARPVEPVREKPLVVVVSLLGATGNVAAAWIRHRGWRKTAFSALRASANHAVTDAFANLAVIAAVALPVGADPIVTLAVVGVILWSASHAWSHHDHEH